MITKHCSMSTFNVFVVIPYLDLKTIRTHKYDDTTITINRKGLATRANMPMRIST
jgi:hypothetical protein